MSSYKSLLRNLFSAQIKEFRNAKKLTQEEMSERLHITSRAYSDLERRLQIIFLTQPPFDPESGTVFVFCLGSHLIRLIPASVKRTARR